MLFRKEIFLFYSALLARGIEGFAPPSTQQSLQNTKLYSSAYGMPTELPDSLDDSAILAAQGCSLYAQDAGSMGRCRVDFDTSIGDETYTTLKSSTEFMQKFVTALCYEMIPGVQEMRQNEMMALVQAKAELIQVMDEEGLTYGDLYRDDEENEGEEKKEFSHWCRRVQWSKEAETWQW